MKLLLLDGARAHAALERDDQYSSFATIVPINRLDDYSTINCG